MADKNDAGWKVATILGALLCVCIGIIGTSLYQTSRLNLLRETQVSVLGRLTNVEDNLNSNVEVVGKLSTVVVKLTRAIDLLTQQMCYMQTGKPCPPQGRDGQ